MREAGFKHLFADGLAVKEKAVDAKTGGHPHGGFNGLGILYRTQEPAGAVGGKVVFALAAEHGGIHCRNPFGRLPGAVVQGFHFLYGGAGNLRGAGNQNSRKNGKG